MYKLPTSLANRAGNQCSSLDESPSFIEVSFQSKIQKEGSLRRSEQVKIFALSYEVT